MKTSLLRLSILAALLVSPLLAVAAPASAEPADRAAQLLARNGSVNVSEAGPYVNLGTPLVQVSVKLGRPSEILPDGAWLYRGYRVEDSAAEGVLVVRFTAGRVSALTLVTPAIAASLRQPSQTGADQIRLAAW